MGTDSQVTDRPVILFDGVCNLCNGVINFIIDRDPMERFMFASLQSQYGKHVMKGAGLDPDKVETLILQKDGNIYFKSNAALKIAAMLSGPWPIFGIFRIIPGFIRDRIYTWIANNRYQWFGKRNECRIPTPDLRSRFLDS